MSPRKIVGTIQKWCNRHCRRAITGTYEIGTSLIKRNLIRGTCTIVIARCHEERKSEKKAEKRKKKIALLNQEAHDTILRNLRTRRKGEKMGEKIIDFIDCEGKQGYKYL